MRLEREAARVKQRDLGIRYVAFECLCTGRKQNGSFPPQNRQQWRLMIREVLLERGIGGNRPKVAAFRSRQRSR